MMSTKSPDIQSPVSKNAYSSYRAA